MLNSKTSETLVLHVFSLRRARARYMYILRIKPDDVLGNPGVTHHSCGRFSFVTRMHNAAAQRTPLHAHANQFSVTRSLNFGLASFLCSINTKISCAKRSILVSSLRARI